MSDHSFSKFEYSFIGFSSRETTKTEAEFRTPTPPPLRNRDRDNYIPLRIFAFPLPDDHLVQWAKMHIISSETDDWNLKQDAWKEITRQRPQKGWCRSSFVYYNERKAGLAMMIASNRSPKEMAQAHDIDLIQQYRDLLHTDPGWFRKFR
jgi:hypothetical protein